MTEVAWAVAAIGWTAALLALLPALAGTRRARRRAREDVARVSGGMGLAFVRRIVESWGGRVSVGAPPHGRGAVFRLMVPQTAGYARLA